MPSIDRIDQFNEFLTTLGNEPKVAASRGEAIEMPPRPEGVFDEPAVRPRQIEEETPVEEPPAEDAAVISGDLDDLLAADDPEETAPAEDEIDLLGDLGLDDDIPLPADFTAELPDIDDSPADEDFDLDDFDFEGDDDTPAPPVDAEEEPPVPPEDPAPIEDTPAPEDTSPPEEEFEDVSTLESLDLGDDGGEEEELFDDDFSTRLDSEFGEEVEIPEEDAADDEGFSLDDFGDDFDVHEEALASDDTGDLDDISDYDSFQDDDESGDGKETPAAGMRTFTDRQFQRMQETLAQLPLNVRIAVKEAIGNGEGDANQLNRLLDLLIQGAAPTAVAEAVSKTTGTRVVVPKGYRKLSGIAFEEEQRTLRYRMVHVYLPLARTVAVLTVILLAVSFLSWRFIYRPIHAAVLYRQGYEDAQEGRFLSANETFERAWELAERPRWFARYARAFVSHRQYDLAVEKYDQLVFGMDPERRAYLMQIVAERRLIETELDPNRRRQRFRSYYDALNVDRPGILEHALLQSEVLADYERAQDLYSILLFDNRYDYDGLMGSGDNFLRWSEEDPARLEDARRAYADLMATFGESDPILMRFLQYFIRTNNLDRVRQIVHVFEVVDPDSEIEPRIYAAAAGYLLDNGLITDVRSMLIRAYNVDVTTPEVHYHLARYNRAMRNSSEERAALDNAQQFFAYHEPLTRNQLALQIDTDILSAEYWYERGELLQALEDSQSAFDRYVESKESGLLAPSANLARVFSLRGDIEYFAGGDFVRALRLYDRAAANGFEPEDLNFKRGFILYDLQRYDEAVERFLSIGSRNALEGPVNLLWSRANTLYHRGNYAAAEATYRRLLRTLTARRDQIETLLIDEDPAHLAVIEHLYRVNNNLGVTLFRQYERDSSRQSRFAEALDYLRISAEISENLLRDTETATRPLARNLAFLNVRALINPEADFEPQIFDQLPRTVDQLLF